MSDSCDSDPNHPLYKSCGFLGFFRQNACKADFEKQGYDPSKFDTKCGFLGFFPTKASMGDIPISWRDSCTPDDLPPAQSKDGVFYVTGPGECTLQSCTSGSIKTKDGACVDPGTTCTPVAPQLHASYTYAPTGQCELSSCAVGMAKRPPYGISVTGSATCPVGYAEVSAASACKAAAAHYGVPYTGAVHEPGLMPGCVVHGVGDKPAKASYNTNKTGSDAGGKQFVVCSRDQNDACVKTGTSCGGKSNYKWSSNGFCQGTCDRLSDVCATGDKCCSGVCTPETLDCPDAASLKKDATTLASQITSLAGSFNHISAQLTGKKA